MEFRHYSPDTLPIGNRDYQLDRETQKYLKIKFTTAYPAEKYIIIVNEPHNEAGEQFNLYKGLAGFFDNHSELIPQTAFLSEGHEANTVLSLGDLKEEDPDPPEELIREVLESFSITGYMAYEWKRHHNIPIIGTEDKIRYDMAANFYSVVADNVDINTATNEEIEQAAYYPQWYFSVVIRNKSMAATAVRYAARYKNPILFIGGGHLQGLDVRDFNRIKDQSRGGMLGAFHEFSEYVRTQVDESDSAGIYELLQKQRIGFTFITAKSTNTGMHSAGKYADLFHAQRKKMFGGTTVESDPKRAVEIIRRKKQDIIYHRTEINDNDWFHFTPEQDLWNLGPSPRGLAYERERTANIGPYYPNNPVIDDIRAYPMNGIVTSMKTLDTRTAFYQDPKKVYSRLKQYVDDFDKFDGVQTNDYSIPQEEIKAFHLEIGIPSGRFTEAQRGALLALQEYGQAKGVRVIIAEVD